MMTPLMQLALLPPVFAAFQRQWPQVSVELVEVPAEQMLMAVEGGQADLAISFKAPVGQGVDAEPLFRSRLIAVIHPAHRLASRKTLRWADLAESTGRRHWRRHGTDAHRTR